MADDGMPLEDLLVRLEGLVAKALPLWDVPAGARARLINVSENATYLIEAPGGYRSVLRVHRANYRTHNDIESELAWIEALGASGAVVTPAIYIGKNGDPIQQAAIDSLPAPRYMVLFHFVEGHPPDESADMVPGFEELGAIAARTHNHSIGWPHPAGFTRRSWDIPDFFGKDATWGDWRDAPEVTPAVRAVLERVERRICERLEAFGRGRQRYGLVHADMRLANLLVDKSGTRLIDFDDCGPSWFLYDFATGISFIEDDPRVPALKAAWVRGYRTVRDLPPEDEAEIDTFVMLRRMALLAWIGSHIEAPEPQALARGFAATTARLGTEWLATAG